VQPIADLAMITGNIGRPGVGVNPLRGQNNVQGACDMGALPNVYPSYQPVTDSETRNRMAAVWKAEKLPDKPGLTATEIIPAIISGQIKGLYIMGENPALSDANINHVEKAFKEIEFLVVQDIFLTDTTRFAHVVLPGTSWAEKDGTFTNTERRVQRVNAAIAPIGNSFPDWRIIQRLAQLMGSGFDFSTPEQIFNEIRRVTPIYSGINYARLQKEGGIQWPCPDIDHPGTPFLHKEEFKRGKGLFTDISYKPPAESTDTQYPLLLTTGRIQYHYHTGTMTRRCNSLNMLAKEAFLDIHPDDAEVLGIQDGNWVRVASRRGEIRIKARISASVDRGVVFSTFHYNESPVNKLTNGALDPLAKIPELKVCAVHVEKTF
jgi:predicted molibdopterin-dependent oxidoreductase YjgC